MRTTVFRAVLLSAAIILSTNAASRATDATLTIGSALPETTFQLVDGKRISTQQLAHGKYMLWLFATWCPSCWGGTKIVAERIGYLRVHHIRVVELKLYNNLGAEGPDLRQIMRDFAGNAARSPNWYWGNATSAQSQMFDPRGVPDVYFLVRDNRVVAIDQAPGATWSQIADFAEH